MKLCDVVYLKYLLIVIIIYILIYYFETESSRTFFFRNYVTDMLIKQILNYQTFFFYSKQKHVISSITFYSVQHSHHVQLFLLSSHVAHCFIGVVLYIYIYACESYIGVIVASFTWLEIRIPCEL